MGRTREGRKQPQKQAERPFEPTGHGDCACTQLTRTAHTRFLKACTERVVRFSSLRMDAPLQPTIAGEGGGLHTNSMPMPQFVEDSAGPLTMPHFVEGSAVDFVHNVTGDQQQEPSARVPAGTDKGRNRMQLGRKGRPKEQKSKVHEAIERLGFEAQEYGKVYNACSHTYLMVRDSATQDLGMEVANGNSEALQRLLLQMQDTGEGFVREQAAKAAGTAAMDDDDIHSAILPLLSHENHDVRRTALIAIKKRLHSDRVVHAAKEALEGRVKEFDRERAGITAVHQMVEDVNGRCRFAAVDCFAKLISQFHYEAVQAANSVLEDDEEWVRRFAAELVGKALMSCQDFYRSLSPLAIPNVKEGFNELIGAGIRCYEAGLTLKGGGDSYMRRIAIAGLCVVAGSEDVCHFDPPQDEGESTANDTNIFASGDEDKMLANKTYFTPRDAIMVGGNLFLCTPDIFADSIPSISDEYF
jgi:hypothetical protein